LNKFLTFRWKIFWPHPCSSDSVDWQQLVTFKTCIWLNKWQILSFFWLEKCLKLISSPLLLISKNAQVTFAEKPEMKLNKLKKQNHVKKLLGYRCKSNIDIFAWMVPWNYAYSPFKLLNKPSNIWEISCRNIVLLLQQNHQTLFLNKHLNFLNAMIAFKKRGEIEQSHKGIDVLPQNKVF